MHIAKFDQIIAEPHQLYYKLQDYYRHETEVAPVLPQSKRLHTLGAAWRLLRQM